MSTLPRVAICIGHSRMINGHRDGGAVSVGGIQEWTYNRGLADMVGAHLTRNRLPWFIVDHYQGSGYGTAMQWLAEHIEDRGAAVAIELHFNSAGETARGHEWLHWHSSKEGKRLAESLDYEMRLQLPPIMLPARGLKPRIRPKTLKEKEENRGWQFTNFIKCPAVICEPFFGSNDKDWAQATVNKDKIAIAIANGISEWMD